MSAKRAKEEPEGAATDIPVQSDEAREAALASSVAGSRTATGQAREELSGSEAKRISGLESRGSTVPIAGGDEIKADFAPHEASAPVGLQAQPASFTTNGSLDPAMVASPTGLVPVSAVTTNVEDAAKRVTDHFEAIDNSSAGVKKIDDLTDEDIDRLDGGTLRAIASDMGLDIGLNGTRTARRRMKRELARFRREGEDAVPVREGEATGEVPA